MTDEGMSQEIEQPTADLTDEQVDKFFENGGDDEVPPQGDPREGKGEAQATTEEKSQEDGSTQETPEQTEEKHARNYQAAMKEERIKRQQIEQVLAETRAQQAKMEERFQKLFEIKERESQPQVPSFDEDPLGHQQHVIKELQDYVVQQNDYLQKQQELNQREYQRHQFERAYMGQAQEFSKSTPDFMDAYNYLVTKKLGEYVAAGLTADQANKQITHEESQVVALAFQQGVNPAERVYAMAKASGYIKSQGQHQTQTPNENAEVAKKLDQIQKSIAANKSLSQAGGKADTKQSISLQAIADMDDDEFDKVDWAKLVKAA